MLARLNSIVRAIRLGLARKLRRPAQGDLLFAEGALARVQRARRAIGIAALVGAAGWVLLSHPPLQSAGPGEVGVRTNLFTGSVLTWKDGSVLAVPGVHRVQLVSVRDRVIQSSDRANNRHCAIF